MSRTITRLFDTPTEALAAVEELEREGIDHDCISLVSNNSDNWHANYRRDSGPLGDRNRDGENDVAEGAGKGAATGGLLGGGAGLLAGLGMLAIPGLGPVVAAGWLASTAVGAVVGAAAGGATGGILGALKEAGHTDEEANVYAEGVRRGGTLVSVKAEEADAARVEQILNARGVDVRVRGDVYRTLGWTAFDPSADAFSADEIRRERQRYQEQRSFADETGVRDRDPAATDDPIRERRDPPATPREI